MCKAAVSQNITFVGQSRSSIPIESFGFTSRVSSLLRTFFPFSNCNLFLDIANSFHLPVVIFPRLEFFHVDLVFQFFFLYFAVLLPRHIT